MKNSYVIYNTKTLEILGFYETFCKEMFQKMKGNESVRLLNLTYKKDFEIYKDLIVKSGYYHNNGGEL